MNLSRFGPLFEMFRHHERGDMVQDPNIPLFAKRVSMDRYKLASSLAKNKEVLDIGCGYGYGSYILALGARNVVGIDEDEEAVTHAKSKYNRENLKFHQVTAIDYLSYSYQKFDLVVMFEVLEHVVEQKELLKRVKNSLRGNGLLVLSTPNRRFTPFYRKNPYHLGEHSFAEVVELLGHDFSIEKCLGQVPGRLALVPLPYFFLVRIVQSVPGGSSMTCLNRDPNQSRTMIVFARNDLTGSLS